MKSLAVYSVRVRVRVSSLHQTPWGVGQLGLGLAFAIKRLEV